MRTIAFGARLGPCLILASTLLAGASRGEDALRLRAAAPKPAYRPGESILLKMSCAPGMTDEVLVLSGPCCEVPKPFAKCPHALVEVRIPRDFVGRGVVSALPERGQGDIFSFKVKSEEPPADLHITSSGARVDPDECSTLGFHPDGPGAQPVQFFAEQPDGTLFDLCKGAEVRVTTDQPASFRFATNGHSCSITSKREGSFKLVATYGGLRKEFSCRVQNFYPEPDAEPTAPVAPGSRITATAASQVPAATAVRASAAAPRSASRPGLPLQISIPAFRNDPLKLDHHPMDVGRCRLLEHWTTGYCYVYGLRGSGKVSETTDVRCDDLVELRKRMLRAIEAGHCN